MFQGQLTQQQLNALMAPLNRNRVSTRSQGGRSLSYLEAWDVKAALIRVFGFANFSADVVDAKVIRMEQDVPAYSGSGDSRKRKSDDEGNPAFNWSVTAQATVRLHLHLTGATYTETAIASQTGPDVGEVSDFAMKTAESDALKRAAIYLGTQFGLSLYDNGGLGDVVRVILEPEQKRRGRRWHARRDRLRYLLGQGRVLARRGGGAVSDEFKPWEEPGQEAILEILDAHLETQMKTLVSLRQLVIHELDHPITIAITSQNMEATLFELVTDALALITVSWAMCGPDFVEDETPESKAFLSELIEVALARYHTMYHDLIVDFEKEVGPIPTTPKE